MNNELKAGIISFMANINYSYIIEQDMFEFTLPSKIYGFDYNVLRMTSDMLLRLEVPYIVSVIRREIDNRLIKLQEIKNEATKKHTKQKRRSGNY
jgi:hypothetical protein